MKGTGRFRPSGDTDPRAGKKPDISETVGRRLSDPGCEAVRMQSDDRAEPIEWDVEQLKSAIGEWESVASQILECLERDVAAADRSANWRPHAGQIAKAVETFRDRCRDEAERLGLWREDGLLADEAYEAVWDEADRLLQWLQRMMR